MIAYSMDDRIASIALDRPTAYNALSIAGWRALADAVARAADEGAKALLLRSAAKGMFSAGSDLKEMDRLLGEPAARAEFRAAMRGAMDPLRALPFPTLAIVDGGCFGAGVALALACDIRIAGPKARFAITPAKLGLAYPQEDVARLVEAVGRGQAARLLFGAAPVDADEAARIGLVQQSVADAEAQAAVYAGAFRANARTSFAALKATLNLDPGRFDPAQDAAFDAAFDGADLAEGLAAFHEKRKPDFA